MRIPQARLLEFQQCELRFRKRNSEQSVISPAIRGWLNRRLTFGFFADSAPTASVETRRSKLPARTAKDAVVETCLLPPAKRDNA